MHPKQLLEQHGHHPKKGLGQNFLWDEQILARMVKAAGVTEEDNVVEVGPGLGHLTRQLAAAARHVTAVELDDRLLPILEAELAGCGNVTVRHADILSCDPAGFYPGAAYRVVANVPYYITAPILRHFLASRHPPLSLTLTVQKEVAQRLTAAPGDMSLLAFSVQYYGDVRIETTLKAGAFWPRPDVDSAVITIDLADGPAFPADEKQLFALVRTAFANRRKQLQKNLRALGRPRADVNAALAAAGIEGRRRAQSLTMAEWGALYAAFRGDAAREADGEAG